MPSKQIVFADRLVGLTVQNGLVRLDLAVNAGQVKDKEGKTGQRMEVTSQLVMPVEAFANAVNMQQNVLKQIVARAQAASQDQKADKAEKSAKGEKPAKA